MTDAPKLLRVVDVETTSKEADGEVCEFGWCDFARDTGRVLGGDSYLCGVRSMPPEVRAVHHIFLEDIGDAPAFDPEAVLADALSAEVIGFVAHKVDFEAQWLGRVCEGVMPFVCTYKAALRVWPDAPTHSNFGLFYWLWDAGKVSPDRSLTQPSHRARPDAYVTAWLLHALFEAGVTGKELMRWTREPAMLPRCPIGKFRGKPWDEVEHGFLVWMVKQTDMEADLKWLAQCELERRSAIRSGLQDKAFNIDPNYGDPHR